MFAGDYPVMVIFDKPINIENFSVTQHRKKEDVVLRGQEIIGLYRKKYQIFGIEESADKIFYLAGFNMLDKNENAEEVLSGLTFEQFVKEQELRIFLPARFVVDQKTKKIKEKIALKSVIRIREQSMNEIPVIVISDESIFVPKSVTRRELADVAVKKELPGCMSDATKAGLLFGGCFLIFLLYQWCSST